MIGSLSISHAPWIAIIDEDRGSLGNNMLQLYPKQHYMKIELCENVNAYAGLVESPGDQVLWA